MRVDVHNHFWPQTFYEVTRKGRPWHGMTMVKDPQGREKLILQGQEIALPPELEINPEQRAWNRKKTEGIDLQLLCISTLYFGYDLEPKAGAAYCRDVNRNLAEIQRAYLQQYRGLALLPLQDTRTAMAELEHAVKDLGLRGIVMGGTVAGKNLDDPSLLPIFQAAAQEGLFVLCHPPGNPAVGADYMRRHMLALTIGVPLETTLGIMHLIFGGVLDKCPGLKICFCQGGGTACYSVGRIDQVYRTMWEGLPKLPKEPSRYLREFSYDSMTFGQKNFQLMIDVVGSDRVLLGTDHPFQLSPHGEMVKFIEGCAFLSDAERRGILGLNAAKLLGLQTPAVG